MSEEQYQRIKKLLPKQRGNVKIENVTTLNVLVYMGKQVLMADVAQKVRQRAHCLRAA
ncbi:hypothetical protein [Treponema endosymbiont of Eucomonympha sp.]|uniref:hypothetical protein n=1 Tax=Treponema endosymbiont of Eucomonympha sp. TaxID=1580831 RepID=UPI000A83327D|nr:hypothetical protein [Treponema endosymbiont of Eucomonympha sp.]